MDFGRRIKINDKDQTLLNILYRFYNINETIKGKLDDINNNIDYEFGRYMDRTRDMIGELKYIIENEEDIEIDKELIEKIGEFKGVIESKGELELPPLE